MCEAGLVMNAMVLIHCLFLTVFWHLFLSYVLQLLQPPGRCGAGQQYITWVCLAYKEETML